MAHKHDDHRPRIYRRRTPREPVDQSAHHRSHHHCALKHARPEGHRAGEHVFRHHQRQERLRRRTVEAAHHAIQYQDRVNRPHRREPAQRQREQQRRDERESHVAALQNALPRKTVGCLPRNQKQQNPRQELRQPHQSQVQRAVRQCIDLPSHRHRLHLAGDSRQHSAGHVEAEIRILKRDASACW